MYTATASPYLGRSDRRARTADATLNWNVNIGWTPDPYEQSQVAPVRQSCGRLGYTPVSTQFRLYTQEFGINEI